MARSQLLREHVDRLIAKEERGEDPYPHDQQIKPAWRKDIFLWSRERLKLPFRRWSSYNWKAYRDHKWDGTPEPLAAAHSALTHDQSVAISSATGIGKTYFGAILVLWWLDCWEGSQVITLAPKEKQLTLHIWKEIGRLWPLFEKLHPKAEMLQLSIRMRPGREDWAATGFACGVAADEQIANKARGFHAEHMLFICEETTGIHKAILTAIEVTCTAPHNLRVFFGNPDSDQDSLALISKEPGIVAVRASALDHPNVVLDDPLLVPGATSLPVIMRWKDKYGDGHPLYESRARGIAPGQGVDALIRREWLVRCSTHDDATRTALAKGAGALGVDVANSEAGDEASWCYMRGASVVDLRAQACPDANAYGRNVIAPYLDSGMVKANRCGVDNVGVGVGTVNELKRLRHVVTGLNGGEEFWEAFAKDGEVFPNLRCQMWWQARMDLSKGLVSIPPDPELWADLLAPKWWPKNGKIWVESKEDFKKRLGRSPNKGDAFVYANWIRQAQRTAQFGTGNTVINVM